VNFSSVVLIFAHQDAMQVQPMLCSVCLSVCPFIKFVDSVKTNKHIFKIYSPSGSHTILVFPYLTSQLYSYGNPPSL